MKEDLRKLIENSELLLFDFDGTMYDSEPLHYQSHSKTLAGYGIELTYESYKNNYSGRKTYEIMSSIILESYKANKLSDSEFNTYSREENILKMCDIKDDNFHHLVLEKDVEMYEFIKEIIDDYKTKKIFKVLSAEHESFIRFQFERWGILSYFNEIVSTSDNGSTKGEELDKWLREFNYEEILFFEDAEMNLKLGKERSIKTVGIEHEVNKERLVSCDILIPYIV